MGGVDAGGEHRQWLQKNYEGRLRLGPAAPMEGRSHESGIILAAAPARGCIRQRSSSANS